MKHKTIDYIFLGTIQKKFSRKTENIKFTLRTTLGRTVLESTINGRPCKCILKGRKLELLDTIEGVSYKGEWKEEKFIGTRIERKLWGGRSANRLFSTKESSFPTPPSHPLNPLANLNYRKLKYFLERVMKTTRGSSTTMMIPSTFIKKKWKEKHYYIQGGLSDLDASTNSAAAASATINGHHHHDVNPFLSSSSSSSSSSSTDYSLGKSKKISQNSTSALGGGSVDQELLEYMIDKEKSQASRMVQSLVHLIHKHDKIALWNPICIKKSKNELQFENRVHQVEQLFNIFPQDFHHFPLKRTIARVFIEWEKERQMKIQHRLLRQHQLRNEIKFLYTNERILFIWACYNSHQLYVLPTELITIICKFLPPCLYGGTVFGKSVTIKRNEFDAHSYILKLFPILNNTMTTKGKSSGGGDGGRKRTTTTINEIKEISNDEMVVDLPPIDPRKNIFHLSLNNCWTNGIYGNGGSLRTIHIGEFYIKNERIYLDQTNIFKYRCGGARYHLNPLKWEKQIQKKEKTYVGELEKDEKNGGVKIKIGFTGKYNYSMHLKTIVEVSSREMNQIQNSYKLNKENQIKTSDWINIEDK